MSSTWWLFPKETVGFVSRESLCYPRLESEEVEIALPNRYRDAESINQMYNA